MSAGYAVLTASANICCPAAQRSELFGVVGTGIGRVEQGLAVVCGDEVIQRATGYAGA